LDRALKGDLVPVDILTTLELTLWRLTTVLTALRLTGLRLTAVLGRSAVLLLLLLLWWWCTILLTALRRSAVLLLSLKNHCVSFWSQTTAPSMRQKHERFHMPAPVDKVRVAGSFAGRTEEPGIGPAVEAVAVSHTTRLHTEVAGRTGVDAAAAASNSAAAAAAEQLGRATEQGKAAAAGQDKNKEVVRPWRESVG